MSDYTRQIEDAAMTHGVNPHVLAAMLQVESTGRPEARSPMGAGGLMQLMPGTAKMLGVQDVNDPTQNITGAAKYLKQLLQKQGGDLDLALASYNAGPTAVRRFRGIPPFPETQAYVKKVKDQLRALSGE